MIYTVTKRIFDLAFSAIILVVFLPVVLLLAIWIKSSSPGPVFYRGRRVGLGGKPFSIFKFRTMVINADQIGGPSTAEDDPRITTVGKFIRRYKLDEIPQFLNVLMGDMSIVGPRPEVQQYVDMYTEEEKKILTAKPGITDYASIKYHNEGEILAGSSDPEQAYLEKIRPGKLKLQLQYVQNRSFVEDVRIVFATVATLLKTRAGR
jgi:lipopolysaccharide/colanic/teichoic acid biosynthesis glycosyltransferase